MRYPADSDIHEMAGMTQKSGAMVCHHLQAGVDGANVGWKLICVGLEI